MERKIENFEEWNEEMAIKYNPDHYHHSPNLIVRFTEFMRARAILKFLSPAEGDYVLDVGCGAGNMLQKIKKGRLYGVDLSETLLELARARLRENGAILFRGNVECLSEIIRGQKFNKIFCSEVLEHVENPGKVIDEMIKLATADGRIVISIPNEPVINFLKSILIKLRIFDLLFKGLSKKMDEEWHLHNMDMGIFRRMVKGKLRILKIKKVPYIFLPIRYVFLCAVE